MIEGEQVELAYVARDRTSTTRVIHPLGLAAKGSVWYLVAHTDLTAAAEAGVAGKGVGFFLLGWTIFTLYMLVCALRTNTVLVTVFGLLFATFLFLTLGKLLPSNAMTTVGGYLGLLTAAGAWYGSMAGVMNATAKRIVLPVFPRN